jgi:hypothetical protein
MYDRCLAVCSAAAEQLEMGDTVMPLQVCIVAVECCMQLAVSMCFRSVCCMANQSVHTIVISQEAHLSLQVRFVLLHCPAGRQLRAGCVIQWRRCCS